MFLQDAGFNFDPDTTINLSVVWWTFLISTLAPIITGFITKRFADSTTKTYVLAFVTTLATVLSQIGQTFQLSEFLTQLVFTFFTAIGLHYQLLKKVGVTGSQGIVNKVLPDVGIGENYTKVDLPEAKGGPGDDRLDVDPKDVDF